MSDKKIIIEKIYLNQEKIKKILGISELEKKFDKLDKWKPLMMPNLLNKVDADNLEWKHVKKYEEYVEELKKVISKNVKEIAELREEMKCYMEFWSQQQNQLNELKELVDTINYSFGIMFDNENFWFAQTKNNKEVLRDIINDIFGDEKIKKLLEKLDAGGEKENTELNDRIKRFKVGMTEEEYEKYKKGENWVYQDEKPPELYKKDRRCSKQEAKIITGCNAIDYKSRKCKTCEYYPNRLPEPCKSIPNCLLLDDCKDCKDEPREDEKDCWEPCKKCKPPKDCSICDSKPPEPITPEGLDIALEVGIAKIISLEEAKRFNEPREEDEAKLKKMLEPQILVYIKREFPNDVLVKLTDIYRWFRVKLDLLKELGWDTPTGLYMIKLQEDKEKYGIE